MSLELDLSSLASPKDKMSRICESINEKLHQVQFRDTVTELELQTIDSTLYVYVHEDTGELIQYPSRDTVGLLFGRCPFAPFEVCEGELVLDSHLSGFVYRVQHGDRYYVKKDIPGSDATDRFFYEIRALLDLHDCGHVVKLEGIVLDDTKQLVKGILVGDLENGSVVELLGGDVPWRDRCRWAKQAVLGLYDVHAEGYVHGDFTLSSLAIDEYRDAKIIDFNRRGCPIGWEAPELADYHVSLYTGEKSDLFQLGMILWALAMNDDKPERHSRPLSLNFAPEIPGWYRNIVATCLSPRPRDRLCAERLIRMLPQT
jgi:serine/threonine protein kinase